MRGRGAGCLLALLPLLLAAEGWSGRIEIVEEILLPEAPVARQQELDALIAAGEARLARIRELVAAATGSRLQVLHQDQAAYEAELDRARHERGGRLVLARRSYLLQDVAVGRGRLRLDSGGAVLLVSAPDQAVLIQAEGETTLTLQRPTPLEVPDAQPGPPRFGRPSLQGEVMHQGRRYHLEWLPDLPNPWAASLLSASDDGGRVAVLAGLPGLPVLCRSLDGQGGERLTRVVACETRAVTEVELSGRP